MGAAALVLPPFAWGEGEVRTYRNGPLRFAVPYPTRVERNPRYVLDGPLTRETSASAVNNFYEFTTNKKRVYVLARKLKTDPWSVEIGGLCKKQGTYAVEDLLRKLPQEERCYRFRCVERWAMAVPWIGIPFAKFLDWAEPTGAAKYVRFVSFHRRREALGQATGPYRHRFPYEEALRMDEAANELTMLVTGMYGRKLPKQNGAPLRVIVPWKYGYKSPKSIVRIEFTRERPKTFWNEIAPREYSFLSNVDPTVPHPRWSQEYEWLLNGRDRKRKTLPFNGYAEQVAHLYR